MCPMNDAIQNGICDGWVAKQVVPFLRRELAGQQHMGTLWQSCRGALLGLEELEPDTDVGQQLRSRHGN